MEVGGGMERRLDQGCSHDKAAGNQRRGSGSVTPTRWKEELHLYLITTGAVWPRLDSVSVYGG